MTIPVFFPVWRCQGGEGSTVPFQTPSTLWVVVRLTSKHLPSMWITVVVSLHTRVKQLPSMWINVVVSLHTCVKHLPSLWISVMVGYHEGGWNTVTHSSQLFEKNSTLWKLFFNSLKNFSHLFEKFFSTLWKMFKG